MYSLSGGAAEHEIDTRLSDRGRDTRYKAVWSGTRHKIQGCLVGEETQDTRLSGWLAGEG